MHALKLAILLVSVMQTSSAFAVGSSCEERVLNNYYGEQFNYFTDNRRYATSLEQTESTSRHQCTNVTELSVATSADRQKYKATLRDAVTGQRWTVNQNQEYELP